MDGKELSLTIALTSSSNLGVRRKVAFLPFDFVGISNFISEACRKGKHYEEVSGGWRCSNFRTVKAENPSDANGNHHGLRPLEPGPKIYQPFQQAVLALDQV